MGIRSLGRKMAAALIAGWCLAALAADGPRPVKLTTTADHSKFAELQREFRTPQEVTKACLACHTEAAGQIQRTKHWTWEYQNPASGQKLGKKDVINNFCISVASNNSGCMSCHIGYGWKDKGFDFAAEENVDCLVCHDTSGIYKKPSGMAAKPVL